MRILKKKWCVMQLFIIMSSYCMAQTVTPLNSGISGVVRKMCFDTTNNFLYVSGPFQNDGSGTVLMNQVARWNGVQWDSLGSGITSFTVTWDMHMYQGDLLIGGSFSEVGGVSALGLAKWDGNAWSSFATALDDNGNPQVKSIYVNGSDLYIGGSFTSVNGMPAYGIARYDGTSWHSYPQINYTTISDIIIYNNELYIGGSINNGIDKRDILKYDGSAWQSVGGGFPGAGWVNEFCIYDGELVVCGYFQTAWGDPGNNIAKWDGSSWSQLQNGLMPSNVHEVEVYDGKLYAVGQINAASSIPLTGAAVWDGFSWIPFTYPFNLSVNDIPLTLESHNGDLYFGGQIGIIDGIIVNNIFKYNFITGISDLNSTAVQLLYFQDANYYSSVSIDNLILYNLSGVEVYSQSNFAKGQLLDISNLSRGFYLAKLQYDNKDYIQKVVQY